MVHGDNAWGWATLREFFSQVGRADIIVGYTRNMWQSRAWRRTIISKMFTMAINLITRRGLQYYNGAYWDGRAQYAQKVLNERARLLEVVREDGGA